VTGPSAARAKGPIAVGRWALPARRCTVDRPHPESRTIFALRRHNRRNRRTWVPSRLPLACRWPSPRDDEACPRSCSPTGPGREQGRASNIPGQQRGNAPWSAARFWDGAAGLRGIFSPSRTAPPYTRAVSPTPRAWMIAGRPRADRFTPATTAAVVPITKGPAYGRKKAGSDKDGRR